MKKFEKTVHEVKSRRNEVIQNMRQQRIIKANELIELIAVSGRKFFNYTDNGGCIGHFELRKGRTYFIDGYTKKSIYAYENRFFRQKFTEGGTMQALVMDIAEFIRTGEATNAKNGYGGVYCHHWGYSDDDMKKIQHKAIAIGFSKSLKNDIDRFDYL